MILNKTLIIDLKSPLLPGSGEGWGNFVDNDLTYDEYGIPYIPARRIRGILRETMLKLEQMHCEGFYEGITSDVFGNEESSGSHFLLNNAYINHLEEIHNEIDGADEKYNLYFHRLNVLNGYTNVRYQTAIDDFGIAKKNNLRSSRVIRKGLNFYAEVELEDIFYTPISKCVSLIHHMGMNRTRGFGEVDLCLVDFKSFPLNVEDNQQYEIELRLHNVSQLSLNNNGGSGCLDYLSGSSILGFFANRYLSKYGEDDNFNNLFVNGDIIFENAYVSDANWNMYMPSRQSLYKQKVGENYYDKCIDSLEKAEILSKIRGKYVFNQYLTEVNKEMVYHHRRPLDKTVGHVLSNETLEDGMFYQKEVLSANQNFVGKIIGSGKDLKRALLNAVPDYVQIGSSKFSQYGNVKVQNVIVHKLDNSTLPAGSNVVCTFASPMVILNNVAEPMLEISKVAELLHVKDAQCFIDYEKVGGYNSKWKLQKPSYVAFAKGCCIRGTLTESMSNEVWLGILNHEGFGKVVIEKSKDICKVQGKHSVCKSSKVSDLNFAKPIVIRGMKRQLHLNVMESSRDIELSRPISASLLGRVLRMLEVQDWNSFQSDVEGIADLKKRKEIKNIVSELEKRCEEEMKKIGLAELMDHKEYDNYKEILFLQSARDYFTQKKVEGREA